MRGKVVAGIDVGGTFTDLILIDGREGGGVSIAKTPTTTDNQAYGVVAALGATKFPVPEIDLIVHGTTTTTNAVLERRLARTGMITTEGFRDIIELGRRTRPQPYGMTGTFVPVIPRNLRLEVPERVEASGKVRLPLDEGAQPLPDGARAPPAERHQCAAQADLRRLPGGVHYGRGCGGHGRARMHAGGRAVQRVVLRRAGHAQPAARALPLLLRHDEMARARRALQRNPTPA